MSYAVVDSRRPFGILAKAVCECAGGERCEELSGEEGSECCPWDSWSNATYRAVKGGWSLRHQNEKRVREAFRLLLDPVPNYGTGMEQAAWQSGATQPPSQQLLDRIGRAAYNFHMTCPASRWYKQSSGVETGCGSYSIWKTKVEPVGPERVAALEDAVGRVLPQSWKDELLRRNEWAFDFSGKPLAVVDWQQRSGNAIVAAPGGEGRRNVRTMPKREDLIAKAGEAVVPSPWLQQLLDAFAPVWTTIRAPLPVKLQPLSPLKVATARPTLRRPSLSRDVLAEPDEEEEETAATATAVATGIGLATAVVAGIWLVTRR